MSNKPEPVSRPISTFTLGTYATLGASLVTAVLQNHQPDTLPFDTFSGSLCFMLASSVSLCLGPALALRSRALLGAAQRWAAVVLPVAVGVALLDGNPELLALPVAVVLACLAVPALLPRT